VDSVNASSGYLKISPDFLSRNFLALKSNPPTFVVGRFKGFPGGPNGDDGTLKGLITSYLRVNGFHLIGLNPDVIDTCEPGAFDDPDVPGKPIGGENGPPKVIYFSLFTTI
jgi:hypothetical protein